MTNGETTLSFRGELFYWRGPSPFYFVRVPEGACQELKSVSSAVTYGWGMIPATVRIGGTEWTTALFPKNGGYLVPVKDRVREAENLEDGSTVAMNLRVGRKRPQPR